MGQMSHEEFRQMRAGKLTPRETRQRVEEALQRELIASFPAILRPGVIAFHVPNERASRIERMRLSALGVLPGVADLAFVQGGRVFFLELKTPGGRLSRAQRDFRDDCARTRTPWAMARDLGQALGHLLGWGLCREGAKFVRAPRLGSCPRAM